MEWVFRVTSGCGDSRGMLENAPSCRTDIFQVLTGHSRTTEGLYTSASCLGHVPYTSDSRLEGDSSSV